jgi:lactate dehydrogenase-like 2-hydroxyacid dehydrogenase
MSVAARRPAVLLVRHLTEDVEQRLHNAFEVLYCEEATPPRAEQLAARVAAVDAICPTVADRIDGPLLESSGGRVRIVANFGVGYDNVDIAAARRLGVAVTNTPDVLTEATADLAVMLMLMVARRAGEGERLCRNGGWTGWGPTQMLGRDLSGKTLGLVGFGRIAQAVARRARLGFDMQILVHSRSPVDSALLARWQARQCRDLPTLLADCDFVSLHCPSTPQTRHLLDAQALRRMRASAYLINTARGSIVDEVALAEALEQGVISGAGLDVFENEPRIEPRLLALQNVVLLPHLGSATRETRAAMGHRMVDNLVAFFAGREPRDRVA